MTVLGLAPGASTAALAADPDPAPVVTTTVADPAPDGTADPSAGPATPVGWSVAEDGAGGAVATWRSAEPIPVTSARPEVTLAGQPVAPVTLAADGRGLSVAVPPGTDPADLAVTLSGQPLDGPAPAPSARSLGAAAGDEGPLFGFDPGRAGSYAVTTSDYSLPGFSYPGFPGQLEMAGHVVVPRADQLRAAAPLVLFLHGRHQACWSPKRPDAFGDGWPCAKGFQPVPSQLGYDYLQRRLASQGYLTVSIAANGINAQDYEASDGGAKARAALVRRHLDQWAAWASSGKYAVDLQRTVLVGHSRGGEGVDLASQQVPLSAPYRIAGQVLLGPTDFARRTAAYVPTVTVLPYCDGDVSDLQGQQFTDASRGLADGDTALKSSVLVMGANHNFFNTEWTPGLSKAPSQDDWFGAPKAACGTATAARLTKAEQRAVGTAYVAGAVQLFTRASGAAPTTLPMFDGTRGHVASTGDAVVHTHAVGGGRSLVLPGTTTPTTPSGGAGARLCRGYVGGSSATACGARTDPGRAPHWAPEEPRGLPTQDAFVMSWTQAGAQAGMQLDQPLDLSRDASVDLRVVADPARGTARIGVRLTDANGRTAEPLVEDSGLVAPLPGSAEVGLAKLVAQDVRVSLRDTSGVLDLTRITRVELVGRSTQGRVFVLDVAGVPAQGLPAVPARRLPTLTLGSARVTEAGDSGRHSVSVPWRLSAPAPADGRFTVVQQDPEGAGAPLRVDVAAGQTTGSVEVPYTADDVYSGPPRRTFLQAFAVRNVGIADGDGAAVVVDDEQRPTLTVSAPASVREGDPVEVTVTLSAPVGYEPYLTLGFAKPTSAPRATLGDLPRDWARRRLGVGGTRASSPLWGHGWSLGSSFGPGRTTARFTVPTARDSVKEGSERIRLHVRLPEWGQFSDRTVLLRDR
ncbi:hypothetical protein SAMN04488570_3348 [Nocardioides scoriae]|uniref:Alpha/beta hydrolase family protein n=2 Tax=Nocardioides scoriae TaxID=642780 RepID=A0A1H1X2H7_9ACTN|nr:hypothetical protein SAMN04488570_3348 [Nocardioides scoriae]